MRHADPAVTGTAELPIVQYWHEPTAPPDIEDLFGSFRAHNPDRRHLVFDRVSAAEFIERNLSAREAAAFDACAVPAMQADYFRYCAILTLGGVYSDVDHRCICPFDALFDGPAGGRLFRRGDVRVVVNGFFAFSGSGHPLLRLALDVATRNIEDRIPGPAWTLTGPAVFSTLAHVLQFDSFDEFLATPDTVPGGRFNVVATALARIGADRPAVAAAFEDVSIAPLREGTRWLEPIGTALTYKRTPSHWTQWDGPTYR